MTKSVNDKYKELEGLRSTILDRAEDYSAWTLPSIFPLTGTTESTELQNDIQSFGAQAVNHLSNKLMIGLFGPSRPFFRLEATDVLKKELAQAGVNETSLAVALQNAEKESIKELDRMGARDPLTLLLQYLIITGNCLLYFPEKGKQQVYNLRNYVVERDLEGFAYRMMTCDKRRFGSLPAKVRQDILLNTNKRSMEDDQEVELVTDVRWDDDRKKYIVTQHAENVKVNERDGVYSEEDCPYIPLVWKLVRGEDYGRGLVEDYSGDFHSLSTGEESLLEIMGILSEVKGLVNPAGITDVSQLNNAANGDWVAGREEDISLVQFDKINDITVIQAFTEKKERRLSKAFLMDSAGIRDAERVTAEEIRLIARDLEMALGGVYTRLAQTLQLPVARRLLDRIDFKVGSKRVEPIIVTGLEALSRSGDLDSFRLFVRDVTELQNIADPEIRAELNIPRIIQFIATNNNFDTEVALNTEEEKEQNAAKQQAAQEAAVQDDITMNAAPKLLAQEG